MATFNFDFSAILPKEIQNSHQNSWNETEDDTLKIEQFESGLNARQKNVDAEKSFSKDEQQSGKFIIYILEISNLWNYL